MSWKKYGGVNNYEKSGQIEAYSLSVNKLTLKEAYQGIFDICGELNIAGGASIRDYVTIGKNMDVSGNVTIGVLNQSRLTVNSDTLFNGPIKLNSDFIVFGNIKTRKSLLADENVYVGQSVDFSGGSFLYSSGNLLGVNTLTPNYALDISTNVVNGFAIHSSAAKNENIIAQNGNTRGVVVGVDTSSAYIHFYYDNPIGSGNKDAEFYYSPGGHLLIDVSQNLSVGCPMTISDTHNKNHLYGELFTVYDVSYGKVLFENIYGNTSQNPGVYTGYAGAFVSDASFSTSFVYVGTPAKVGAAIGGGAYPLDTTRSMVTIGLNDICGNYTPAQVIVSGNISTRNYTTTGFNTYKPRTESYAVDVNGPIHIDNGDIADSTGTVPFELYSMSVANDNRNVVVAL
jgi:hypothetical protein